MIVHIKTFRADSNMLYLIQNLTKESSNSILSYFHDMALSIADHYVTRQCELNKRPIRINKTLKWHYKDTCIPYRLSVYSWSPDQNKLSMPLFVSLAFPPAAEHIDVTSMLNSTVENIFGLEGAVELPPFERPNTRIPSGFKKLLHK